MTASQKILPDSYRLATFRNITPITGDAHLGLGFDVEGEPVRLRLSVRQAVHVLEALRDYLPSEAVHSCRSSGSPRRDVSPIEGQNV